jgi:uncharacterized membrane protein YhiD involved in acid resistance
MNPFVDFSKALGATGEETHVEQLFLRMALAAVLGAFVAYRVWRRFLPFAPRPALQGAQAQTLIAAAGALVIVVIGDNVARAFGLVGLGSFIRFRSGIKDPRDAAVMFVMIGIGMACGLGHPLMAVAATAFVSVILIIFDATARGRAERTVVSIHADDPAQAWSQLRTVFPSSKVVEMGRNQKDVGKLVVQLDLPNDMDAAKLMDLLSANGVQGLQRVALED